MKVKELMEVLKAMATFDEDVYDYEVNYTDYDDMGNFRELQKINTTAINKENKEIILSDNIF